MATVKTYRYSDINLNAGRLPNALVYEEDAINQNILLIIMTPIRAAWFDPGIGCIIMQLLFDPIDDLTAFKIQKEILTILPRHGELRVKVTSCRVLANPDAQDYYVDIGYEAPGLDGRKIHFVFNMGP